MELTGKKILFVITKSNWGGAQRYVYDLATAFKEKGAEVKVAYGGTGEANALPGALADKLSEAGIEGILLPSFMRDISLSREYKALTELLALFKKETPHVVHLNSSKAGGIGALAARLSSVPNIVFTSHGLAFDEDRGFLARGCMWLATWATFLLSHAVIVLSRDAFNRARRFPFCASKMHLIQNGIRPLDFLPPDEARAKLFREGNQASVWIGTIAELTRNKGVGYLIDAAKLLRIRGHVFQICVIGMGEHYAKFKKEVQGSGLSDSFHFAGFLADAAKYLSAFDIFTLTSVKEGQPYVLLEAAQAGCAVVASRIPGITDVINDHTGMLVTPKNPVAIAVALEKLITDASLRQTLGTALKMDVARTFSLEHMIEQIAAVYG